MKNNKGFTLIELMTVMAIVAVLVGLITVSLSSSQGRGRDLERKSEVKAIQDALEQYYAANGFVYPNGSCNSGLDSYLKTVFPTDPDGSSYIGANSCTTTTYCICGRLESGSGGNTPQTTCADGSWGSGQYYCVTNLQ